MSFLLNLSTYFVSTLCEIFKLGLVATSAFGPVSDDPIAVNVANQVRGGDIFFLEFILENEDIIAPLPALIIEEDLPPQQTPLTTAFFGLFDLLFEVESVLEFIGLVVEEGGNFDFAAAVDVSELQPLMLSELNFVRHALPELTLAQKRKVWSAAEASIRQSSTLISLEDRPEFAQVVGVLLEPEPDPQAALRREISRVLKANLPGEWFEHYVAMTEARNSQRKRAAILRIVSKLDGDLYLSQSQRDQLIESISSNWKPSWSDSLSIARFAENIPAVPELVLSACLNELQQAARQSFLEFDQGQPFWVFDIAEDDWWMRESESK